MKLTKPTIATTTIVAASTLVVGGIAWANVHDDDAPSASASTALSSESVNEAALTHERGQGRQRQALTGENKTKAEEAAKAKVPGGTVNGSFATRFGAMVELTAADKSTVRILLDDTFEVMSLHQVWKDMPRPERGGGHDKGRGGDRDGHRGGGQGKGQGEQGNQGERQQGGPGGGRHRMGAGGGMGQPGGPSGS